MIGDLLRRYAPSPKQMLWGVLGGFAAFVVLVVVGYLTTSIPNPNSIATQQATYFLYSNGKVLAHGTGTNRIDVPLARVPSFVQHEVLAAEDRNFEHEAGISPTGIVRALVTDLRGGDIKQGGSTITQQYVKNAYLTQQRTFTRKIREIFIAVKLAQEKSKDEILQDYLNTIYFGRGAYGIEAASEAYFHRDVAKLNVAQGALLAAVIRGPSLYEPTQHRDAAVARWHYVVDGMVSQHWLSSSDASSLAFPGVYPPAIDGSNDCVGPNGFICQAVLAELMRHGFSKDRLEAGGYRVYTTIDVAAEAAAIKAETDNNGGYLASGPDKGRESALVSVQPGDGAIRAMYGGDHYCSQAHQHKDSCTDLTGISSNHPRSPGSSFKPYTLIAALQQGIGLNTVFNGPAHIDFPGTGGKGISNSQNETCPHCTLTTALAKSINTIFVPLAQRVGPDKVAQVAKDAGVDTVAHPLTPVPTITLGTSDVSVLDQAVGYATIAAQGIEADPYLVSKVVTADGQVVYRAQVKTHRVFAADVMADTTYAMTRVLAPGGTAAGRGLAGRPAAGKTGTDGTVSGNKNAWFVGFTPQLATAVWFGNADHNHQVTWNGGQPLYGGELPAMTWQEMMNAALQNQPVQTFPPSAHVGQTASPSPTSSPSSTSPSPTNSPTAPVTPLSPSPTLSLLPPPRSHSPSHSPTASPKSSAT